MRSFSISKAMLVIGVIAANFDPIGKWFRWLGFTQQDFEAPHFRYFVGPLFIGGAMSGPPLALSLIFDLLANRYELVITHGSDRQPRLDGAPLEVQAT
jgi:hypothetical protein